MSLRRIWRDYGFAVVAGAAYLLTEGSHASLVYVVDELYPPHTAPWYLQWAETVTENLSSEMFQTVWIVVLLKYLAFKGSPESKEPEEAEKERHGDTG